MRKKWREKKEFQKEFKNKRISHTQLFKKKKEQKKKETWQKEKKQKMSSPICWKKQHFSDTWKQESNNEKLNVEKKKEKENQKGELKQKRETICQEKNETKQEK